ncbi:MAG: TVP38/TMEM64 family protein [Sediminicola sp.]
MTQQRAKGPIKKSRVPLYASLILSGILVLAYFYVPGVREFFIQSWNTLKSGDGPKIKQWVDGFGLWGPVVIILAMILQMFLLVIPSLVLMVVSILAYGPIWGSLLVLASIIMASSVGYWIGSYFGPVLVNRLLGPKAGEKSTGFLEKYGFWAIIITRLNPFLSNDAISFVAGILRMGYWKFIGATVVGIAPLIFFIAILGKSTDSLQTGLLWSSVISLLLFVLYVYWDKRKSNSANG